MGATKMLIVNDCVKGLRTLRKRPWQSLAIILIIAVGIGTSSAYYSAAEALLLRPLPFDPEGRVVNIEQRLQRSGSRLMNSYQNLMDLREQCRMLDGVAVYQAARGGMIGNGQPEFAQGISVDRYFFPLLGVTPALGRGFTVEDETNGAPNTMILSYPFWQQRFAGDQTILGQDILLDKRPYTVVGIMPQSFYFPFVEQTTEDFWLPLRVRSTMSGDHDKYGIARIKPGASFQQAESEVMLIGSHIRQSGPGRELRSFSLHSYREVIVERLRPMLVNLAGIVICILLVVCINAANLLLVEAMRYRPEVEIRFALGGARWQIVRLFLFRALVLALAGGLVGAGLAWILVVLTRNLLPAGFPGADQVALNMRLLWFAATVSLGTGILFGLWPALKATQKLHKLSLNGERRVVMADSIWESRRFLVVLQLTFSAAFLVVTGLLGASFYRLLNVKPGILLDHRVLVTVTPTDPDLKAAKDHQQFFSGIREQLLSTPGVQAVAVSSYAPLAAHGVRDFRIQGVAPPKDAMEWMAEDDAVSPNYFEEFGIALREGRPFSEEDHKNGKLVVIVNEAFAQHFLGSGSPLGRQICVSNGGLCPWREIVGVVMDARDSRIDSPATPAYFVPLAQAPPEFLGSAAFTVRTNIAPASVLASIQKLVSALAPEAIGTEPYTMEEMRSRQLVAPRHRVWFLATITALALLLAAMGVYGVIAGAVEQRRHEIGVRVALGAPRKMIAALFYRQMLFMLLPGLLLGLTGAGMLVRYIASILFETTPIEPVAYCGAALVLSVVAALATALPVRRALRVSAAEVLRTG
jgi:putative ABC transport system permease protein